MCHRLYRAAVTEVTGAKTPHKMRRSVYPARMSQTDPEQRADVRRDPLRRWVQVLVACFAAAMIAVVLIAVLGAQR
jgi:hypothetical protein